MRVVVTGAAGMIGSNIAHGLNATGVSEIIAVDDLRDGQKFRNLLGAGFSSEIIRPEMKRITRGDVPELPDVEPLDLESDAGRAGHLDE